MQKKERYNTNENILHHSSLTFFKFSSSLLLEYGRWAAFISNPDIRS